VLECVLSAFVDTGAQVHYPHRCQNANGVVEHDLSRDRARSCKFIHVHTHNTYKAQKRRQYKTPKQGPEGKHMQAESRETAYKRRSFIATCNTCRVCRVNVHVNSTTVRRRIGGCGVKLQRLKGEVDNPIPLS